MLKIKLAFSLAFLLNIGYLFKSKQPEAPVVTHTISYADTPRNASRWPAELTFSNFTRSDLTPRPSCLVVAATGEVFVGVDQQGSLGKAPGRGSIVKLVDSDNDGKVDKHSLLCA